jgi:MoaA/NifB/PqqE/SkfB family radical SAM enzyme
MTNAFWARNDDISLRKLKLLKDAGLTSIGVSISRFHEQFVPSHRVERALRIASQLGISTELKAAITLHDLKPHGEFSRWQKTLHAEWLNVFPVLPYLRDGEVLPDMEYYRETGLPVHKCPGDEICVDFNGVARSCCSLGTENTFLAVGNTRETSLRDIHGRFERGGKQRILRQEGPIAFARAAIVAGLGDRLRDAYAGPCDLCMHIRADTQLRSIAEQMALAEETA